jgi:hypothetical protein
VGPARCEPDGAALGELIEAGIPVDLYNTTEPGEVKGRTFGFAIWVVEIDCSRRIHASWCARQKASL